jgi:hypothetical protein
MFFFFGLRLVKVPQVPDLPAVSVIEVARCGASVMQRPSEAARQEDAGFFVGIASAAFAPRSLLLLLLQRQLPGGRKGDG